MPWPALARAMSAGDMLARTVSAPRRHSLESSSFKPACRGLLVTALQPRGYANCSPVLAAERAGVCRRSARLEPSHVRRRPSTIWRRLRTSRLADKAFRETIDYEVGVTLLEASRFLPPAEREIELEKAPRRFDQVPPRPFTESAGDQREPLFGPNVLIARGESRKELAGQADKKPVEPKRFLDEARAYFEEAQKALTIVDSQLNRTQKGL